MRKTKQYIIGFGILANMLGCAKDSTPSGEIGANRVTATLQLLQGCPEVEKSLKQKLFEVVDGQITQSLKSELNTLKNRDAYCGGYYCADAPNGSCPVAYGAPAVRSANAGVAEDTAAAAPVPAAPQASVATAESAGAKEYSQTNNQVVGVDEADFVKNDNKYIYMLSGDQFIVIEAFPAESAKQVASVKVNGQPFKLFVEGDRAVVFSQVVGDFCYQPGFKGLVNGDLRVTVFDIASRNAPRVERELELNGHFVDARRVGDAIHTVVAFEDRTGAQLMYWPENYNGACDAKATEASVRAAFDGLKQKNRTLVDALNLSDFLPAVKDTDVDAQGGRKTNQDVFSGCENFLEPSTKAMTGVLALMSFSITDDTALHVASTLGYGGQVYASDKSLYIAVQEYQNDGLFWLSGSPGIPVPVATVSSGSATVDAVAPSETPVPDQGVVTNVANVTTAPVQETFEKTLVHKFTLGASPKEVSYVASGRVDGHVKDQFSIDEFEGRVRLATTAWSINGVGPLNKMYVLEQAGKDLNKVGESSAFGETGETIRSVRFAGNRAFAVTFRQTDPFYAIEFVDGGKKPEIRGALKIPGFSSYMHFLDDTHVLTTGFDATADGRIAGVALQIFDVGDLANPKLTAKQLISTQGSSSSEANQDHLAFTFLASKGWLALPMNICEPSSATGYDSRSTFNGLQLYHVSVDKGFELLGGINHLSADPGQPSYDGWGCFSWWGGAGTQVRRSVILDNYVFSIATDKLKLGRVDNNQLVTLPLAIDLPQSAIAPYSCIIEPGVQLPSAGTTSSAEPAAQAK